MKNFKNILFRELNFIKEETSLFALIILAPFFFAFFYSTVYSAKVETNIKIAVIDNDNTETSRNFTRNLDAHQQLSIYSNQLDFYEAKELIKKDKIPAFLFIDKGFEKDLKQRKSTNIPLFLNNTRFLTSNDINKAVNETAAYFGAGIKLKYFESNKFNPEQSLAQIEPIKIDMRSLYNFTESYGDFVIPGLLALIIQQTLLIGISLTFTKEIEEKKINEFISNSLLNTVLQKSFIYLIFFGILAFFFYTVLFSLFKINNNGNYFALSVIAILHLTASISFGIFISTFLKRKIAVLQFYAFTSLPFFLASGYSWPKTAIPDFINWIMYLIPSTSFLESFIGITQKGQGLEVNLTAVGIMLFLSLIYFPIGFYRLRKLTSPLNSWD